MQTFDQYLLEKQYEKSVDSSHIEDIQYDSDSKELEVTFWNGDIYRYYDVELSAYKQLVGDGGILKKVKTLFQKKNKVNKHSYGSAFWQFIRNGGYRYEKVG